MGRASKAAGLLLASALLCAAPLPAMAAQGALAGQAVEAGAPQASVARLEAAAAQGRIATDEADGLLRLLAGLKADGLPVDPFTAKMEEGLAKGVPGPAIVRALERMRGDYVFVRETLTFEGEAPPPQAVDEAGESLRLGLSREDLASLAAGHGPSKADMVARAASIQALLSGIGFPRAEAAGLVRIGLAHATLSPSWVYLSKTVLQARERGVQDGRILESARAALSESGSYNDFLVGIGFTTRDMREKGSSRAK